MLSPFMVALGALVLGQATPDAGPAGGPTAGSEVPLRNPQISATFLEHGPAIDGDADEPAWSAVPWQEGFTQQQPDPNVAPTQPTRFKVAYDAERLYVAIRCDDSDPSGIVDRLTRRDRQIDADGVDIEIDSLGDKSLAYGFGSYSSGTQFDYLRTGDYAKDTSWDAVWASASKLDGHGYTVEMAIPFRVLRFKGGGGALSFRINVERFITRREENDQFVLQPTDSQGALLRMATLDGLKGLSQGRGLELLPFVVAKVSRRDAPAFYDPPSSVKPGFSIGGDATYHPTADLVLDATVLPDFGQVEADEVVLNLSSFETYFPEKRPFFVSGSDLFALHDEIGNATTTQLFYSRRVGRPPGVPALGPDQRLRSLPLQTDIWGAAKLSGKIASGLNLALLDAVPSRTFASVQDADGRVHDAALTPLSNYGVARLRADLPRGFTAGATLTAVNHRDRGLAQPAGCPESADYAAPAPDGRCTHDAYAAALDANWTSPEGDYVAAAALYGSLRRGGPPSLLRDGTVLDSGATGTGGRASFSKGAGHFIGGVSYEGASTRLDLNDAGYLRQSNVHDFGGAIGFRTTSPVGITLNSETDLSANTLISTDGVRLGHAIVLNPFVRFTNYMQVFGALIYRPSAYDIRETRDGAPYQRTRTFGGTVGGSTDGRAPVGVSAYVHGGNTLRGVDVHSSATAWLNLFGRLELRLNPQLDVTTGDPRWVGTDGDPSGAHTYRFADLDARAYSLTLNGTYTFSPTLSLQAQGQLYFDTAHYGQGFEVSSVTTRPYVYLERLKPAATPSGLDYKDGALNLSVVLRWEYRPGSVLFLVYSRSQLNGDPTEGQSPLRLDAPALRRGPSDDVLLVKASYYFGA